MDVDRYVKLTRRYLAASGERRLEDARRHLAEDAVLEFPSGRFRSVEDLAADAGRRYRSIRKRFASWDVVAAPDGTVVVVVTGTLQGENAAGVPFEGVRFIDRLVYRDDLVVLHQVWNDLAESGVLERRG